MKDKNRKPWHVKSIVRHHIGNVYYAESEAYEYSNGVTFRGRFEGHSHATEALAREDIKNVEAALLTYVEARGQKAIFSKGEDE